MKKNILKYFSLEGKIAVVTGASYGLGRAMAVGLAEAGAMLLLLAGNLRILVKLKMRLKV